MIILWSVLVVLWLVPAVLLFLIGTPGMGFWSRVRLGLLWPYFICLFLFLELMRKKNDL
jgi:hypothetical protein